MNCILYDAIKYPAGRIYRPACIDPSFFILNLHGIYRCRLTPYWWMYDNCKGDSAYSASSHYRRHTSGSGGYEKLSRHRHAAMPTEDRFKRL